MKKLILLPLLLFTLIASAQISTKCAVCPPTLRGVTNGAVLRDSSGHARWQSISGLDTTAVSADNFWKVLGNSLTDPSVNFIGTTDGANLSIQPSTGNVGIGITTPTAKLEVHANNGTADAFQKIGYANYSGVRGLATGYVCDTANPTYHHAENYIISSSDAGFGDSACYYVFQNSYKTDSVFSTIAILETNIGYEVWGGVGGFHVGEHKNEFIVASAVTDGSGNLPEFLRIKLDTTLDVYLGDLMHDYNATEIYLNDGIGKVTVKSYSSFEYIDTFSNLLFQIDAANSLVTSNIPIKINDGTQANGYGLISDGNGLGHWGATTYTALDSVSIYALTPTEGTVYRCTDCDANGLTGASIVSYLASAWRRIFY